VDENAAGLVVLSVAVASVTSFQKFFLILYHVEAIIKYENQSE
jgi:hypothetical protein